MADSWLVETTNKLTIKGLVDENDEYINDLDGGQLIGDLFQGQLIVENGASLTFDYLPGSDGDYVGIIPHTIAMQETKSYDLYLTGTRNGTQVVLRVRRTAKYIDL